MRFVQYLIENDDVSNVLSGMSESRAVRFKEALNDLEKYKQEGELTATELKNIKDRLNYGASEAWGKLVRQPYFHAGRWESVPSDVRNALDFSMMIHTTPGKLKKLTKLNSDHPAALAALQILSVFAPIAGDLKELKGKVVKKKRAAVEKEKSAADKQRQMMGNDDVERVRDALVQITQDLRDELFQNNSSFLTRIIGRWHQEYDPEDRSTHPYEFYKHDLFKRNLLMKTTESSMNRGRHGPVTLKDDYEETVKKEAERMTRDMIDTFIIKNTQKLAPILSQKNNLKQVSFINSRTDTGTIEGTLKLEFEDNSEFVVTSKVVFSYSKNGRPFSRYPTTFHQVTLPDGSKMRGRASEERMNTEFLNK